MENESYNFISDNLIEKGETDDYFEIEGICSTEDTDKQNEIILQSGLDLSDLETGKGYFNADHGYKYKNKDQARMGLIDSCKVTPKGLYIKGKIWKNHPEASIYYNEIKHGNGVVKFSVEGKILQREREDDGKNLIKKCKITGVALTRNPVNENTYASLVKSLFLEDSTLPEEDIDVEKGGAGSGRKRIKPIDPEEDKEKKNIKQEEKTEDIEITVKEKDKKEESHASGEKDNDLDDDTPQSQAKVSDKRDRTEEKRNAMLKEIKEARNSFSGEDLKERIKAIKLKYTGKRKRKRDEETKKSINCDIIIDMIKKDEQFKELVRQTLIKSEITSGGDALTTKVPQDMSNSEVFLESNLEKQDKKKKKKKNKELEDITSNKD